MSHLIFLGNTLKRSAVLAAHVLAVNDSDAVVVRVSVFDPTVIAEFVNDVIVPLRQFTVMIRSFETTYVPVMPLNDKGTLII